MQTYFSYLNKIDNNNNNKNKNRGSRQKPEENKPNRIPISLRRLMFLLRSNLSIPLKILLDLLKTLLTLRTRKVSTLFPALVVSLTLEKHVDLLNNE